VTGVLSPEQAFTGFANQAVFAVAALFVVAAGVQRTRALEFLDRTIFRDGLGIRSVLFRMMGSTSFFSAFLNNTPIVAMLIPQVQGWAKRSGFSASRLLIPLSYAAIVGGTITLIGTSTNLIVSGMIVERGHEPLSFFQLSWVGLPAAVLVMAYFSTIGYKTLPKYDNEDDRILNNDNDYHFDLKVPPGSDLAYKTVEEAGLRALGNLFLVHVHRKGHIVGPVGPHFILEEGDILTFTGDLASVDDLAARKKLERAVPVLDDTAESFPLFEAVVSPSSSLVGKSLKESRFRDRFGGVVLGIQRRSETIRGALGRVPVKAGDLLLIEAKPGFDEKWNKDTTEFYLVSRKGNHNIPMSEKAPLMLVIVLAMILSVTLGVLPMVAAALMAALIVLLTGIVKRGEVLGAVNLPILLVIAAAIGVGQALEVTGIAQTAGGFILSQTQILGVVVLIAALYAMTNILTELITNNAAAVLMLPLALVAGIEAGLDPHAVAVTVAIASSASFLTPIGYQTNLMVMSAGQYKFTDYLRTGFPVTVILMILTVAVVNWRWT